MDERGTDGEYTNEIHKVVFGSGFLYILVYNIRVQDDAGAHRERNVREVPAKDSAGGD